MSQWRKATVRRCTGAGVAALALGLSLAVPASAEDSGTDTPGAESAGRSATADRAGPTVGTQRSLGAARESGRRTPQSRLGGNTAEDAGSAVRQRAAATVAGTAGARSSARESRRTEPVADPNVASGSSAGAVARHTVPTAPVTGTPTAKPAIEVSEPAAAGVPPVMTEAVASAVIAADAIGGPVPPAAPRAARAAAAAVSTVGIPAGRAAATSVADIFTGLLAPIQGLIEGVGLLIRRTLFNQAPQMNPEQTTGQIEGPITGTLRAVEPEGEPMTFQVTQLPQYGSVVISSDGNFTYTPGPAFSGLDSFTVTADDIGFGFNLFNLFRPTATESYVQVAQNADQPLLTFAFNYGAGSQYWSAAARTALQSAAMTLAQYIVVDTPTMLNFDITAENSTSSTLASASSNLIASDAGFYPTVAQHKILTGLDANGSAPDGDISVNFGVSWGLGSTVSSGQYDFTAIAMHELMHTLGFLTYADRPGSNTGRLWTEYDSFLVDSTGAPVIGSDYRWDTAYNLNLIGRNGGLFFGGPTAVDVYGGLVPLYTPTSWESGSSVSHLDDRTFSGANAVMMTALQRTGLDIRVLSPLELAILADLGYRVSPSPLAAFVLLGFGFLRRPRRIV